MIIVALINAQNPYFISLSSHREPKWLSEC
jgi:hypothetical protein